MKILAINKFYYRKGGSETHFIDLVELLRKNNHEVIVFSTKNEKNVASQEKDVFIEELEMRLSNFRKGFNLFYNYQAIKALRKLIEKEHPEIVHIHNISHHFSLAILKVFKEYNLPVIMTVHDYKLICPNYKLFNQGHICEKCQGGKYYHCTLDKCVKNSYFASLILMLEAYWSSWKKYFDLVDVFIAPSLFMRDKLLENGLNKNKLKYLPNFLKNNFNREDFSDLQNNTKYVLFFGRLVEEKGLLLLIKVFGKIKNQEVKLKIAGAGPLEKKINEMIVDLKLDKRIELVGYLEGEKLKTTISNAQFIIVPSIWYENAPYSILEAYALGKAVLGAKIGGISELINDAEYLFSFHTENELAERIDNLVDKFQKNKKEGVAKKLFLEKNFNEKQYLKRLLEIYQNCLDELDWKCYI